MATIPPEVIDRAVDVLVDGVTDAAGLMSEMAQRHRGALLHIAEELCQEEAEQTRRMAATILTSAFMFHEVLAGGEGMLERIRSVEQLRDLNGDLTKSDLLAEWRAILKINYWPIFDIARRILQVIPPEQCKQLFEILTKTSEKLLHNRLMRSHDLTGAVFQRLIADRHFLAAYYTTPASATLLVGLAITEDVLSPINKSWSNPEDVKSLRIADFACGTGTLLSSAYHRLGQLHELHGGDSSSLHPDMMAGSLYGCDVLPAAAHLTASMLSGAHPTVVYDRSAIMTLAYGRQPDGSVSLGSIDLLDPQGKFEILSITARGLDASGETDVEAWQSLPHASFDFVIMNPPFTRATAHEGKTSDVPNPIFAAFGSTADEQRQMANATKQLTKGTSAHGNAGEASIFLVLAHQKLSPDGRLALVMPLSLMSGNSWEDSRRLLAKNYKNLVLVSITGTGSSNLAFSADTGMGECLVVGRKSRNGSSRATFVVLLDRPTNSLVGSICADQIDRLIESDNIRRLEDGPVGGTTILFGDKSLGQLIDAPIPKKGGWNIARISDFSLAQVAYQMVEMGRIWLPTMVERDCIDLPVTIVEDIAEIGPIHRDINGLTPSGGFRGPFDIVSLTPGKIPTYPVLWAHDAARERSLKFEEDREAIPRCAETQTEQEILDDKVDAIWKSASHCHFNCDFRFNSQSTCMQFTPRKTIGGTAWISISMKSIDYEKVLVLWANTTFGLLLRWWHSNRQQSGRGRISKMKLRTMPTLDVTALSDPQISLATELFDNMCELQLMPLHELHIDQNRKQLDKVFARDVLGLPESIYIKDGPIDVLRMKLSQEPSIRGSK
jgi:hypothetical protein